MDALLHGSADEKAKALAHVAAVHWKPLYKYLRAQYGITHGEARAMTLNFLAQFQQEDFFSRFDSRKSTVREYLRQRLEVFVPTTGAKKAVDPTSSPDFESAGEEFTSDQLEPNRSAKEYYESEWTRNLLTFAVEELNNRLVQEGKEKDFSLFLKLDLQDRSGSERVTLEHIATELAMPLSDALTSLAKTRQLFQTILLDLIKSFTSSEAEFRKEAQAFFRS
jgi:hypothetical protein